MSKFFSTLIIALIPLFISAAIIDKEVHIVAGSFDAVDNTQFPYLSFCESDIFNHNDLLIEAELNDVLNLLVFNHDSVNHGFEILNMNIQSGFIAPGDSTIVTISLTQAGCFPFVDPLEFPKNAYLGLGGMLVVKDHNFSSFYWNIKAHQSEFNYQLLTGNNVDWNTYNPKFFTINGNSNPNINQDQFARITGQVNDSIYLYISNTGFSIHSMHFHGYHATIVSSSKNPNHAGRIKDTFPIYPLESMVLLIVPDKPGEYPIHDHNLVAVAGNSYYPNGMFTTILISQ